MNAPALFVLAILVPMLLAAMLLVPPYLGMYGAAYIVYAPEQGINPLIGRVGDIFFIINTYDQLLAFWVAHITQLGFFSHALPIAGLPLGCTIASVWATSKLSRKFLNLFYDMAASGQ